MARRRVYKPDFDPDKEKEERKNRKKRREHAEPSPTTSSRPKPSSTPGNFNPGNEFGARLQLAIHRHEQDREFHSDPYSEVEEERPPRTWLEGKIAAAKLEEAEHAMLPPIRRSQPMPSRPKPKLRELTPEEKAQSAEAVERFKKMLKDYPSR